MDLVLKLRELRRMRSLTQHAVAHLSGIGVKTISSFETGDRIHAITVVQLQKLLGVYAVTPAQFFGSSLDRDLAPWMFEEQSELDKLLAAVEALPAHAQEIVIEKLKIALDVAASVVSVFQPQTNEGRRVAASRTR
jgi:transcriptional regulator with XRE-family HTH domain